MGRCKLLNCNKVAAALAALPTPSSVDGDRLILARIIRDRFGSLDEGKVSWSTGSKVSLVKRGFVTVKNTSAVGQTIVLPFTACHK